MSLILLYIYILVSQLLLSQMALSATLKPLLTARSKPLHHDKEFIMRSSTLTLSLLLGLSLLAVIVLLTLVWFLF